MADKTTDQIYTDLIALVKDATGLSLVIRGDENAPKPNVQYASLLLVNQEQVGLDSKEFQLIPDDLSAYAMGFDATGQSFDYGVLYDSGRDVRESVAEIVRGNIRMDFSLQIFRESETLGTPMEIARNIFRYSQTNAGYEMLSSLGMVLVGTTLPLHNDYEQGEKWIERSSQTLTVLVSSEEISDVGIINKVALDIWLESQNELVGVDLTNSLYDLINDGAFQVDVPAEAYSVLTGLKEGSIEYYSQSLADGTPLNELLIQGSVLAFVDNNNFGDGITIGNGPKQEKMYSGNTGTSNRVECTWTRDANKIQKVKIKFGPWGHAIYIDGSQASPAYTEGSPEVPLTFFPAERLAGFSAMYNFYGTLGGLIFRDANGTPLLDYSRQPIGAASFIEAVHGYHGDFNLEENRYPVNINVPASYIGVDIQRWADIKGDDIITPLSIEFDSPFNTDDVFNINGAATDETRAMLRYRDTNDVFLPPPTNPYLGYPNWKESITPDNIIWNPDCWYYNKPMTCISVWSDYHLFSGQGVLVSPRHVLMAKHVADDIAPPRAMTFLDMDNNYQTANIIDYVDVTSPDIYGGIGIDVALCILDVEITIDVAHATFMTDADALAYDTREAYACGNCKEGYWFAEAVGQMNAVGVPTYPFKTFEKNPLWKWSRYNNETELGRVGDSSRGTFLMHKEDLFFLFTTTSISDFPYGKGYCVNTWQIERGYNNPFLKTAIKEAMDSLDDTYSWVGHYDLVEKSIVL